MFAVTTPRPCAQRTFGVDGLIGLYANWLYLVYLAGTVGAGVVLYFTQKAYEKARESGAPLPHGAVIEPCAYATFSALFGTQSVVQAKCLAELLAVQAEGETNIFAHWFTYVVLLAWLATVGVWLHRMNEALSKYNPLFIIPLLQVNFIFFAIVSGGLYFQEFNLFTLTMWVGFVFGLTVRIAAAGAKTKPSRMTDTSGPSLPRASFEHRSFSRGCSCSRPMTCTMTRAISRWPRTPVA